MANDPIVLLVIGFLLTSVLGGGLAYLFQQRAWRHQYEIQKQDHHHQQALKTFEELSSLLDQRLYRMRLIFWAAKRLARQPRKPASLNAELTDYRAILRVWNDNLNRNLALIDTYFGEAARVQLETELFAEYSAIGEELDEFVRQVTAANETPVQVRPIGSRLSELSVRVYQFNVFMLRSLRDDDGHAAQLLADQHGRPGARTLRFGHDGADVLSLQRVLARLDLLNSKEDGHFGRDTEAAVRGFQRSRGLQDDGVVGRRTAVALEAIEPPNS
jgi:Putative peptidoglycan binding domain